MSFLIELLDVITRSMIAVGDLSRDVTYSRAIDIAPFIEDLEAAGTDIGMARCGDDAFCLGDAFMVFAVEPLLTPEGRGLADVAVEQFEQHVQIERVDRSHEQVLSVAGSKPGGWVEGRVLAAHGWVFLISAPTEPACSGLADLLDRRITMIERR